MISTVKKTYSILDQQGKKRTWQMLFLIIMKGFMEMVGVASVMPFLMVVINPGVIETNQLLNTLYVTTGMENEDQFIWVLGILMLIALVSSIGFRAIVTYATHKFVHSRSYALSSFVVESYLKQPYSYFLSKHTANISKTVLSECNEVVKKTLKPLLELLSNAAVVIALVILLFIVNYKLSIIIALGLVGSYVITYLIFRKSLLETGKRKVESNRQRFYAIQECFGGIKEIKITGKEKPFLKSYQKPSREFASVQAKAAALKYLPKFAMEGLTYVIGFGVIFYLMAQPQGLEGYMATLAVFFMAARRMVPALGKAYKNLGYLRFSEASLEKVISDLQILEKSIEKIKDKSNFRLPLKDKLEFRDVSFGYSPNEEKILNQFSLTIKANTSVGIIGPSGSGKTTTVDLILGLLKPDSGQILIDGKPLQSDNLRSWQRNIGYVPQNIYLVDGTIAENIAFGIAEDEIDMQAVKEAAKVANIHDFIVNDLEEGYQACVGERGSRLSGGQKQRIGIARALYHNPDILVLDEATSALDHETEQCVVDAINQLAHRKTVIVIAHRLTTIEDCDTIVNLDALEK